MKAIVLPISITQNHTYVTHGGEDLYYVKKDQEFGSRALHAFSGLFCSK